MKLISYLKEGHEQLGVLINGLVYDMEVLHPDLPGTMNMFLHYWEDSFPVAQAGELLLKEGTRSSNKAIPLKDIQLLAPVPFPSSCATTRNWTGAASMSPVLMSSDVGIGNHSGAKRMSTTASWTVCTVPRRMPESAWCIGRSPDDESRVESSGSA